MSMFLTFIQGVQNMQGVWNSKRFISILSGSVALLLAVLLPPWVNCGELRPYQLPSQNAAPYQQRYVPPYQQPYDSPAREQASGFNYETFEARAASLPRSERDKLKQGLEERLQRALEEKDYTEVGHYGKLLDIVKGIK